MVQLIEIDRLGPRVEGMLYETAFKESWTILDEVRVPGSGDPSPPDFEMFRAPEGFRKLGRPS